MREGGAAVVLKAEDAVQLRAPDGETYDIKEIVL
jgi:hypothetical protein